MNKIRYIVTITVLLVSTVLFYAFVFFPTLNPYEIIDIETIPIQQTQEEEIPPTLSELWNMQKDTTKVMQTDILNREIPTNWIGKDIYFRYTYLGEYDENVQSQLDDLLVTEYRWQKQLDENGNIVLGGILISKDGTYQLHTHNTFSKGDRFFLLGDLLDRYYSNGVLVGTRILFGDVVLESVWERDTRVLENGLVPYADLVVSTCLERYGDRRLISGWNIVRE